MSGTYAPSHGRLKALVPSFLHKDQIQAFVGARDLAELTKLLEATPYGPEVTEALATQQGAEAVEVAVNRHFVRTCRIAYAAAPFAGRAIVGAYLKRWDVENIGLILSAKAYGRPLSETDAFLVSDRQTPAGLSAGVMSLDDLRGLLAQSSLEGVASQLVRFGYGATLLQHLDEFAKTQDLFPLLQALKAQYYADLRSSARFFQGDEWVVRQIIAGEIDVLNLLTLLKGKATEVRAEDLTPLLLDGGSIPMKSLVDWAGLRSVAEIVEAAGPAFPLAEGLPAYKASGSLVAFELALRRQYIQTNLARARLYPLSLAGLFAFLLLADAERSDLRRIIYGKVYNLPGEQISAELLLPRLG